MGSWQGICSICQGPVVKEKSGTSCLNCGATMKAQVIEMDPSTCYPEFSTEQQLLTESNEQNGII